MKYRSSYAADSRTPIMSNAANMNSAKSGVMGNNSSSRRFWAFAVMRKQGCLPDTSTDNGASSSQDSRSALTFGKDERIIRKFRCTGNTNAEYGHDSGSCHLNLLFNQLTVVRSIIGRFLGTARWRPGFSRPGGTFDNSPAIYRWVTIGIIAGESREGRLKQCRVSPGRIVDRSRSRVSAETR